MSLQGHYHETPNEVACLQLKAIERDTVTLVRLQKSVLLSTQDVSLNVFQCI